MISVSQAKKAIKEKIEANDIISIPLYDAHGYALAKDVFSSIDFPQYQQSAMDGYAFRYQDWLSGLKLNIDREVQAGDSVLLDELKPGEAVRIFTGANIPAGADTVVMQEYTNTKGKELHIENASLQKGDHVRLRGSQTKKGDCVLSKGRAITPGMAGFLAGLGIQQIEVYKKPTCCILATGKELSKPGGELGYGKIFESNSYALALGLKQLYIEVGNISIVDDDLSLITSAIHEALESYDVLLLTGGVSVGDYDFVVGALEANGVEQIFHKVKQKPGKPIYFGKKGAKVIFGLPGNPASVLTCYYEYVMFALQLLMGYTHTGPAECMLPMTHDLSKKSGLTNFVRAKRNIDGITALQHQESYKMNAFAEADALIVFAEEATELKKGDMVEVHLLNL